MAKPKGGLSAEPPPFIPAFAALVESALEAGADLPTPKAFQHGFPILRLGEKPKWVGFVHSGMLKLTHTDENGRDVVIGLRSKGWWMNIALVLLDLPSLYTVTALTNCSISLISRTEWAERTKSIQGLLHQLLYSQSQELIMLQKHIILRETSAETRLRHLEDEATCSIWKTSNPNEVLSQRDIADLLSVSPEHLSRLKSKRASLARIKKAAKKPPV